MELQIIPCCHPVFFRESMLAVNVHRAMIFRTPPWYQIFRSELWLRGLENCQYTWQWTASGRWKLINISPDLAFIKPGVFYSHILDCLQTLPECFWSAHCPHWLPCNATAIMTAWKVIYHSKVQEHKLWRPFLLFIYLLAPASNKIC